MKEFLKKTLQDAGVDFNERASETTLKNLCKNHGLPVGPVVIKGFQISLIARDKVDNLLSKRAAKLFPDFIGKLPSQNYITTDKVGTYKFGETQLICPLLQGEDDNYYPVGVWDFAERQMSIRTENGEITPNWVVKGSFSNSVERDVAALKCPTGTKVQVKTVIGAWHSPISEPRKAYKLSYLELAE